jgi:adhesin/invasin
MSEVAETNQSAVAGQLVVNAPSVVVRDSRGYPVSGVSVTFSIGSGGGSVFGPTSVTNTAGNATVGGWRLGSTAGAQSMVARLNDLPDVVFAATALPWAASQILAVSNTAVGPLAVAFAQASPSLPSVRVTDALGNPVGGVLVTFELGNNNSGSITREMETTNDVGIATLDYGRSPLGRYRQRGGGHAERGRPDVLRDHDPRRALENHQLEYPDLLVTRRQRR